MRRLAKSSRTVQSRFFQTIAAYHHPFGESAQGQSTYALIIRNLYSNQAGIGVGIKAETPVEEAAKGKVETWHQEVATESEAVVGNLLAPECSRLQVEGSHC